MRQKRVEPFHGEKWSGGRRVRGTSGVSDSNQRYITILLNGM